MNIYKLEKTDPDYKLFKEMGLGRIQKNFLETLIITEQERWLLHLFKKQASLDKRIKALEEKAEAR